jgi:hypothetical protein
MILHWGKALAICRKFSSAVPKKSANGTGSRVITFSTKVLNGLD